MQSSSHVIKTILIGEIVIRHEGCKLGAWKKTIAGVWVEDSGRLS